MFGVKRDQLVEDQVAWLAARMTEDACTGDHGEREPAECLGDLDTDPATILVGPASRGGLYLVVMVVAKEVFGDLQKREAKAAVAGAAEPAVGAIDAIALIA